MTSFKEVDHLEEDEPLLNQSWVCVSFLSPEGIKNCSVRGLKIRGVYSTREEANKRAEYLQKVDPDFNVFVGEIGKWLPWDPNPESVEDHVYREKELNTLMQEYKKNLVRAKEVEAERKRQLKNNSNENLKGDRKSKIRERLRKKLNEREEKKVGKKTVSSNSDKELTKAQKEAKGINDRLLKIRELYDKLEEDKKNNKNEELDDKQDDEQKGEESEGELVVE